MVFEQSRMGPLAFALVVLLLAPSGSILAGKKKKALAEGDGRGRIYGKVQGADGKRPVAGAVVHAYHLESERRYESGASEKDGGFRIDSLPHGYYDVVVVTPGGAFVANEVLTLPPAGKTFVLLAIRRFEDGPPDEERRRVHGLADDPAGSAAVSRKLRGAEFWKSPKGVLILVGGGTVVLLALASSSDDEASPVFP